MLFIYADGDHPWRREQNDRLKAERYLASTPLRLEQALAKLEAGNHRTSVAQTADRQDESERPQTVEAAVKKGEKVVPRGRIELPTP